MISIDLLRRQPELVQEAGRRRGEEIPVERILELDRQRRAAIAERGPVGGTRPDGIPGFSRPGVGLLQSRTGTARPPCRATSRLGIPGENQTDRCGAVSRKKPPGESGAPLGDRLQRRR